MTTNAQQALVWFAGRRPASSARVRLFCFPYAGLGASVYRSWVGAFGPGVDVLPVQLPGRETRQSEPAMSRLDEVAQAAYEAIQPFTDLPFALFGHSMGALIAFEIARRCANVSAFRHLFVSARRAPHLADRSTPIAHLPYDQFVAAIQHRYQGIPAPVLAAPDLMELLIPRLRADFAALETYVCAAAAPIAAPISVFGGLQDTAISRGELDAWSGHTAARTSVRMLQGPHLFLTEQRDALVGAIAGDLRASCGEGLEVTA